MKKFFALVAVAALGVAANAQDLEALQAKKANYENQIANYDDGIAKKWELRIDAGAETIFGKGSNGPTSTDEGGLIDLGLGYNLNSNWYIGVASGYFYKFGRSYIDPAPNYVPVLADVTYRWNGLGEKWSFFVEGRGGYLFATNGDEKVGNKNYEYKNSLYFDVQPGVYYRMKRNIDLKLSAGYMYNLTEDDEDVFDGVRNSGAFVAKVGFNFRGKPATPTRSQLNQYLDDVNGQIDQLLAEEEARKAAEARRKAEEEAARKAAAEAAARKAAEEEAARLAALEAAKHQNLTLYYELRETDLNADKNAKLEQLADWAKSHTIDKIVIKGYADKGTGNARVNKVYAKNRAEKVKKALIKKYGIDKKMIECTSFGDAEQPFESNDQNRCAIILVNQVD